MFRSTPSELKRQLRADEIERILKFASDPAEGRSIAVVGPGGLGKSTVLSIAHGSRDAKTALIDLGASKARTALGVASILLSNVSGEIPADFYGSVVKAHSTGNETHTSSALTRCVELIKKGALDDICFFFDNIDRASPRVRSWLYQEVSLSGGLRSVFSARVPPFELASIPSISIRPFSREQTSLLVSHLAGDNEIAFEYLNAMTIRHASGHPLKAELIAWACFAAGGEQSTDAALVDIVSNALDALPEDQASSIHALLLANQRLNDQVLTGLGLQADFEFLRSLPFVSPVQDSVGGVQAHEIAAYELMKAWGPSNTVVEKARKLLSANVYQLMMANEIGGGTRALLELEALRYLATTGDVGGGRYLYIPFKERLLQGHLWKADELARLAQDLIDDQNGICGIHEQLIVIENLIAHHEVLDAERLLDEINPRVLKSTSLEVQAWIFLLRARCTTSAAASSGAALFSVADRLRSTARSLDKLSESAEVKLLKDEVDFEFAQASRLIGQYGVAIDVLSKMAERTTYIDLRLRALEEVVHLHRWTAQFNDANDVQSAVTLERAVHQKPPSANGLFALSTLLRDQGNIDNANKIFANAHALAVAENNDFLQCCIQGERAWTSYLDGDSEGFERYLEDYRSIADLYGFKREMAEYWHMQYHRNCDAGQLDYAQDCLKEAVCLADQYGNFVMQLDCRMHQVQKFAEEKNFRSAESILIDMQNIERKGCGIRIFRGRAMVYLADSLYEGGLSEKAGRYWIKGFEIIAGTGTSRSNTEVLDEMYPERHARIRKIIESSVSFDTEWPKRCDLLVRERITALS